MLTMAAPKKGKKRGPAPKPEGPKRTMASFKGSEEFASWVYGLAELQRLSLSGLIEHALIAYAKQVGYEPDPPRR